MKPRVPDIEYVQAPDNELHWCNSHQRWATHVLVRRGKPENNCCAPSLGGTMLPCAVVNLTGIVERTDN